MSMYGIEADICGVPCAMVMRGPANSQYQAVFERERASLEEIEAINWAQPVIEDVAGFQAQVDELTADVASQVATIQEQEQTIQAQAETIPVLEGQLEEADEALIAMYEAQSLSQSHQDSEEVSA